MLEISNTNAIHGGKSNQIKQLPDLFAELQAKPGLQDDLIDLMSNPEIANMLSNPEKMNNILDLFSRMDPAFVKQLPFHYEQMVTFGMI
jgi:hypothetical protein